jgi:hypothetical protein
MKDVDGLLIELRSERDALKLANIECSRLASEESVKAHQAVAACASFRQVAEVVYEWCNSESPSDISSDWVKEKLDATDIGKQVLEEHKRLEANVAKWGPLVESYELENKQLRSALKLCVEAIRLLQDDQGFGNSYMDISGATQTIEEALAAAKPLLEKPNDQH